MAQAHFDIPAHAYTVTPTLHRHSLSGTLHFHTDRPTFLQVCIFKSTFFYCTMHHKNYQLYKLYSMFLGGGRRETEKEVAQVGKGISNIIYSTLAHPKRFFYISPPDRLVHAQTDPASLGIIQSRCNSKQHMSYFYHVTCCCHRLPPCRTVTPVRESV